MELLAKATVLLLPVLALGQTGVNAEDNLLSIGVVVVGAQASPIANTDFTSSPVLPAIVLASGSTLSTIGSLSTPSSLQVVPATTSATNAPVSINNTPTSTALPTAATQSVQYSTYTVQVGGPSQQAFVPDSVNANTGDTVEFIFGSFNHTLTSSSLEHPCQPSDDFDSGFRQFNPNNAQGLRLSFTVNSLDPQWFFCKQLMPFSHCALGMVFAINPGEDMNTFLANVVKDQAKITTTTVASGTVIGSLSTSGFPLPSGAGGGVQTVSPVIARSLSSGGITSGANRSREIFQLGLVAFFVPALVCVFG